MSDDYVLLESASDWSGNGMANLARWSASFRHPWVRCPDGQEWGRPIPTSTPILKNKGVDSGLLSLDDFITYKAQLRSEALVPGSIDVGKIPVIRPLIIRGESVWFQWLSGLIPFVASKHSQAMREIFGEGEIALIPSMSGKIVFVVPRYRSFAFDDLEPRALCGGCSSLLLEECPSASVFFVGESMRIAVSQTVGERLNQGIPDGLQSGLKMNFRV